jgi:hypothetical protein
MLIFERFLFYFLFFAIPFQTRKIFYYSGWYFNEWQSVSLYFTDLVLFILFILWGWQNLKFNKFSIFNFNFSNKFQIINYKIFLKSDFYLVLFLIAALISVKNSSNFLIGSFLWLKFVEFSIFYFYLKIYAIKKFNLVIVLYALIFGGVFQAIIAIAQFLKQGSLGLTYFGESFLGTNINGVASFFISSGEKIIRSYGTTPHPNILAAYLLLALVAFYFVYVFNRININSNIMHYVLEKFWWGWYSVLLFGFLFTFSRTVIFLWAVGFLGFAATVFLKQKIKLKFYDLSYKNMSYIFFVTLIVCTVFGILFFPEIQARLNLSSNDEAVQLRVFYNEESLKGKISLFGIGLGDFTSWLMEQNPNLLSYVYQPVHNIYLLVYKEIGVIGFVFFLLFIKGLLYEFIKQARMLKKQDYYFIFLTIIMTGSVLIIGLFDHFLLTIQQGRFIFWLSLAFLAFSISLLNKKLLENKSD